MRDSFVFYRSYAAQLRKLNPEQFKKVMEAIFDYALDGIEVEDDNSVESIIFGLIKPQLEANNKRYENGCKGAEYGRLGGRPKKTEETEETEKTPQRAKAEKRPTAAGKDGVFTPPTVEEIEDYCKKNGYGINAYKFVDYYTANGWNIGRSPMRDWRAAVRNWEANERHGGEYGEITEAERQENKRWFEEMFGKDAGF